MSLLRVFLCLFFLLNSNYLEAGETALKIELYETTPLLQRSFSFLGGTSLDISHNYIFNTDVAVYSRYVGIYTYSIKYAKRYFRDAVNTSLSQSEINVFTGSEILKSREKILDTFNKKQIDLNIRTWISRLPWYSKRNTVYVVYGRTTPYIDTDFFVLKSNLRFKIRPDELFEGDTQSYKANVRKPYILESEFFKRFTKFKLRTRLNAKVGGKNLIQTIGAKIRGTFFIGKRSTPVYLVISAKHKIEGDSSIFAAISI